MDRTLKEEMQAQLRTDVEIGMSIQGETSEDYFWRGVVIGDNKMIEILDKYIEHRVSEIVQGEKTMSKCKHGDPHCKSIGCDCYRPKRVM